MGHAGPRMPWPLGFHDFSGTAQRRFGRYLVAMSVAKPNYGRSAAGLTGSNSPSDVSRPLRQIVVIGLPETAIPIAEQIATLQGPPVVRGVVLLRNDGAAREHADGPGVVLGSIEDLPLLHARYRFDGALVALPRAMSDAIQRVRSLLGGLDVSFRYVTPLSDAVQGVNLGDAPNTPDLAALVGRTPRPIHSDLVRRTISGQRVAITGAGGSIGSELCRIAAAYEPSELLLIERTENALFEIDREIGARFPKLARRALLHDVVEELETAALFEQYRPQAIFHAAAHKHVPMMEDHPAHAVNNNVFGTKSVADAALACGADRFVLISTDKAVNPSSVMGATKRFAEHYVRSLRDRGDTRCSMVRFGNVLGSSGSVLTIWSKQIAAGRPVSITDERMTRFFMTIPEAAALVIQSAGLSASESGDADVFVLDMGEPVRIVDLAKRFIASHGLTAVTTMDHSVDHLAPAHPIVFTGARPGEKLHEELAHEAEELIPTSLAGVHAWAGSAASLSETGEMMTDLAKIRRSLDASEVLATVRKWTPTLKNQAVCPILSGKPVAGAA